MNITEKLDTFVRYYAQNRGVGHTLAMINGARNYPCIVVAVNLPHAECIRKFGTHPNTKITADVDTPLQGIRLPLVFDNFTLQELFIQATDELHRLGTELLKSKEIENVLQATCASYEARIKRLQMLSKKRRKKKTK